MQTIITPTDFSPASRNACYYAAKTAVAIHANLLLVHIIAPSSIGVAEFIEVGDLAEKNGTRQQLQDLLDELCQETNNQINIEATIISGDIERELKSLCINEKPFAVVIATHTNSYLERFFLGSTTAHIVQHLRFPVIVVPSIAKYAPVKKIALATDLKNVEDMSAAQIGKIVKQFNAELEIFHVCKEHFSVSVEVPEILAKHLPGIKHKFFHTQNNDISAAIALMNITHDIDLLMVIRKKHGLFHKSQSSDFVFNAQIPTMVLHTDDVMEKVQG